MIAHAAPSAFSPLYDDLAAARILRLRKLVALMDSALDAACECICWIEPADWDATVATARSWFAAHCVDHDIRISDAHPGWLSVDLTQSYERIVTLYRRVPVSCEVI